MTDATQPGFHVKGCLLLDTTCAVPFDDRITDEAGNFVLDLRRNDYWSSMYFEVTAPNVLDYRTHLFFLPDWTLTHSLRWTFNVYPRDSTADVPASDPGLGGVLFFTHDCKQSLWPRAAGVEVSARPAGSPTRYTLEGLKADLDAQFTDIKGTGFITNLPPGQVKLSAWRHDPPELIGTTPIVIRADTLTIAELTPTP
jgi:hypothetical protein